MTAFDPQKATAFVDQVFADSIVPTLIDYIRIPNKSPAFDPAWEKNGHMERAVTLLAGWAKDHAPPGATLEVMRLSGRTPLIYMDIPGTADRGDDTVVLYGHLDKQPEMVGWADGKGPWEPVLDGDKLYGRGGADDGYSIFASLTAISALAEQGVPYTRCVVIIEACEESGSYDLPHYIDAIADRIGTPSLVICLDSGCGNYDQMWCTTSLRGLITGNLRVSLLREGVHSGDGSGILASSFRVLRQLLSRLEDEHTGEIKPTDLFVQIPRERIAQAEKVGEVLGDTVWNKFPIQEGVQPITSSLPEMILNRTWRPALSITGIAGLPELGNAGNVLRPETAVKLSLRLPPTLDAGPVVDLLNKLLTANAPYGAHVTFEPEKGSNGWNAPPVAPWLESSLDAASKTFFDRPAVYMGEGGSIPFMGMLGAKFPEAQFVITGVLGPMSNAHGPNEFLHLPTARRLTGCMAKVLADHAKRN